MDTKSKKFLINNSKLKYVSLALSILFLSILFETLFNLKYNFKGYNIYDYVNIPEFYFFGRINRVYTEAILDDYQLIAILLSGLSLIFITLFFANRNSSTRLEDWIRKNTSTWSLENFLIIISIVIMIRFNIWQESKRFYDNPLILMDMILFSLSYVLFQFLIYNKGKLKDKALVYKLIQAFVSKHNKKSLNKKIATILMIALLIQLCVIFSVLKFMLYWSYTAQSLYYSFIISIPTILVFAYIYNVFSKKFTYIQYISTNIKNIENGDLKYELEVHGNDEISNLASSINNITNGLDVALENQIKSEKLKTELITNVSHDLKTPLTSIVNYVDILKNNELDKNTIKDYINILDRKSQRLKALVEDIFEASKISSGDIELNIEKTDIKELLIQSIVELEDKIEKSKLDFVIDTPDDIIFTMIDGKRTFRVFENLINNILKYSLGNTRVYVDMAVENENIYITFKNISNHRLNMKPEELLERFRRGDVSRNTEGSGLGLSIAQNLVSLQGGNMDLFIDGDLFKVILTFNCL